MTDRHTDRQTHRQTNTQTDRHTDRLIPCTVEQGHTDRQIDKCLKSLSSDSITQTDTQTDRHTDRHLAQ